MTSSKVEPYNVVVDKPLVLAVKNSRMRYQQHLDEKKKLNDVSITEQQAKQAVLEKKQILEQVENDLQVINAGLIMTEQCIEEASEEIGRIVHKKNMAKPKLLASQQKLSMGLKKKSELNVELEVLTKKKKTLLDE